MRAMFMHECVTFKIYIQKRVNIGSIVLILEMNIIIIVIIILVIKLEIEITHL